MHLLHTFFQTYRHGTVPKKPHIDVLSKIQLFRKQLEVGELPSAQYACDVTHLLLCLLKCPHRPHILDVGVQGGPLMWAHPHPNCHSIRSKLYPLRSNNEWHRLHSVEIIRSPDPSRVLYLGGGDFGVEAVMLNLEHIFVEIRIGLYIVCTLSSCCICCCCCCCCCFKDYIHIYIKFGASTQHSACNKVQAKLLKSNHRANSPFSIHLWFNLHVG